LFNSFHDEFSFFSNYCLLRVTAFNRTASRIPLASSAKVIEFTQPAQNAAADYRPLLRKFPRCAG
jgi:hypothetical protein